MSTLKSVSIEQIEAALGSALSELLGQATVVSVRKVELVEPSPTATLTGRAADSFRIELTGSTPRGDAAPLSDVPF